MQILIYGDEALILHKIIIYRHGLVIIQIDSDHVQIDGMFLVNENGVMLLNIGDIDHDDEP